MRLLHWITNIEALLQSQVSKTLTLISVLFEFRAVSRIRVPLKLLEEIKTPWMIHKSKLWRRSSRVSLASLNSSKRCSSEWSTRIRTNIGDALIFNTFSRSIVLNRQHWDELVLVEFNFKQIVFFFFRLVRWEGIWDFYEQQTWRVCWDLAFMLFLGE